MSKNSSGWSKGANTTRAWRIKNIRHITAAIQHPTYLRKTKTYTWAARDGTPVLNKKRHQLPLILKTKK
jgi:hypothetical protein